ncbi:hypothetical protein TCA2_4610 [Paenibacillus sp. TCA20]|nr:hypothetical protein TCA2_4610 [Paenibacillus sp. TCA20]
MENGGENMGGYRIIEDLGRGVFTEDLAPKKGDVKENEDRSEKELGSGKPADGE